MTQPQTRCTSRGFPASLGSADTRPLTWSLLSWPTPPAIGCSPLRDRATNRPRCPNEPGRSMKGFKTFVLRGNVVDLAIAVVIGLAFNAVITALVKDIITPLIAAIGGQPNFS